MNELKKWLPWAFDNLQGPKKLLLYLANFFVVLTTVLVLFPEKAGIPWWGSMIIGLVLIAFCFFGETRVCNEQEHRRRNGDTVPPAKPESSDPPSG
jgi:hypothetical protein